MRLLTTACVVLALLTAAVAPTMAAGAAPVPDSGAESVAAAGHGCSFPFTATDATGTEVTIAETPERITTLGPSAAQTMWEIGGKEQVVGLDQYAFYLADAESRTNVSASGFGYDVEKVVGTEADLVLAANITPASTVQKLREAGMTVYQFRDATSIADVKAKTTLMGELTGNCEGAATANKWMTQNVETAQEVAEGQENPRVLIPQGQGYVAADGTFVTAMVEAAGGVNVAAAEYEGYPQLSDEVILELNPEVFVLAEWATYLTGQEPYASTTAGQEGNTVALSSDYLSQPAPRSVVYAVRNMSEGFHPDAAASAEWTAKSEVTLEPETATPTETTEDTTDAEMSTPASTTETSGPGFGVVSALTATLAAALFVRRD